LKTKYALKPGDKVLARVTAYQ